MQQQLLKLNHPLIVLTGLVSFLLSMAWYSPLVFGSIWQHYLHAADSNVPSWTFALAPIRELIASYVIAVLIVKLNFKRVKVSIVLMLLLWLAFHAVGMAGAILWDNLQWQLGMVHAEDWLMKMLFMGTVLTYGLNRESSRQTSKS